MTDMTERGQGTVARYAPKIAENWRGIAGNIYARMRRKTNGGYVCFSDYEALAARLAEVEAERDALETAREMLGGFWAKDNARAEAAEAEVARLRTAAGAAGVLLDAVNKDGLTVFPQHMREALRAISPAEGNTA